MSYIPSPNNNLKSLDVVTMLESNSHPSNAQQILRSLLSRSFLFPLYLFLIAGKLLI